MPTSPMELSNADMSVYDRALALRAPFGIAYIDRALRYVWVSDALASMNGLPAHDHVGRRVAEVLPPTVADGLEVILQGVIDSGEAFEDFDVTFGPGVGNASDGGLLSVHSSFFPVGESEIVGIVGIIQEAPNSA